MSIFLSFFTKNGRSVRKASNTLPCYMEALTHPSKLIATRKPPPRNPAVKKRTKSSLSVLLRVEIVLQDDGCRHFI